MTCCEYVVTPPLRRASLLFLVAMFVHTGPSNIRAENRPPRLEVTPQPTAYNTLTKEDIIRAAVKVSDPDGDTVTLDFRVYDEQGRLAHKEIKLQSSEETVTKTFSFRRPGTYELFVQASDGKVAVQWHQSVVITGNHPPTLTVRRGEPVWDEARKVHRLEATVQIVDPDAGDSIMGDLRIRPTSGPERTHVFNLKRSRDLWTDTVSVTLDQLGGYVLEVVVRDTRGAEARWSDQVAAFDPRNRPPTLKVTLQPVAFNQATQEQIVRAMVDVSDPDGDEVTLDFRAHDEEGRMAHKEIKLYSSRETIAKTFSFYEPGTYTLSVVASDGKASAQWRDRVTIPERQSQSAFPTLQVSSAGGYDEDSRQHSIGATARIRGLEAGATPAVYFQLYDKDGRVGEMRVKLDPSDGTASYVFHVSEAGTYELKVAAQIDGRNLQWSNTLDVRERSSPDPNEPSTDEENPETQGTSEVIMTIPDLPLDLENTGGFGDLPTNLLPDADPNEDVQLEPVEFIPDLVPREDGTQWLAPDDQGFVDPGSIPRPLLMETVTYFDRPWLPQSWKTSGDSRQTRVHIYSAGSRLGWAAALARHAGAPANDAIVEHLEAASGHVKSAYDNSFMPSKAWPDWQQIQHRHESWARQLRSKAGRPGEDTYRRQLAGTFQGHARSLAEKVAYQATGSFEARENCDSYYCRIGYALACGAQTMRLAMEGQANGMDELWVRTVAGEGRSQALQAIQHIRSLSQVKPASGFCIDLTSATATIEQATQGSNMSEAKAQAAAKAWQDILVALGGGRKAYPPDELAGEWAFSDLNWNQVDDPQWESDIQPKLQDWNPDTVFRFTASGSLYTGTLLKDPGSIAPWFSAWSTNPRHHGHLFKPGVILFRLSKVGRNRYQGQRFKAGTPGDDNLYPEPFEIIVQGQVARYGAGNQAGAQVTAENAPLLVRYDPPAEGSVVNIEAVGRHVFANLAQDRPRGATMEPPKIGRQISGGQTYSVFFRRPFRFSGVTDNNPGVNFTLSYRDKEQAFANHESMRRDKSLPTVGSDSFRRHENQGHWLVKSRPDDDGRLQMVLVWSNGDWTLLIRADDYSAHPDTMFGGQAAMVRYGLDMLDKLAPRLKTIPLTGGQEFPAPQTPEPQRPPGGVELLGIERN